MMGLSEQIRRAETRYYVGQLVGLFLSGAAVGSIIGWLLWG